MSPTTSPPPRVGSIIDQGIITFEPPHYGTPLGTIGRARPDPQEGVRRFWPKAIAIFPLNSHLTTMADSCCSAKSSELERLAQQADQRRVLLIVLVINALMFAIEFTAGVIAGSAALMADSVDMFGDALVYGLSLYALSRGAMWKARAALAKGLFILVFGLVILVDIAVKLQSGLPPSSTIMLIFGGTALAANLLCLRLLWRFRTQDVNMSSTFECSRNDVISNVGVLVAAAAVALIQSPWPDIIVGGIIAALFLRSAFRVIGLARAELARA